jgi:hypothetical protein
LTISEIVTQRRISEILHFTTNSGFAGVLATGAVKPRSGLSKDKYLEYIYKANCADRSRDVDWHGYVNLSISRINSRLFNIADGNWHRNLDGWWCILSFNPVILTPEGVNFTTTNNMYSGVERAPGVDGLNALFAPRILQYIQGGFRQEVIRGSDVPPSFTTCPQAEVLYPADLAVSHLTKVYVRDAEHIDAIAGLAGACGVRMPECLVDYSKFR